MSARLPLAAPSFDEAEVRAVEEVVRSGWLTMGPRTAEFEQRFAETIGVEHAVMVSSCTAALHLAYRGLGIGPGDEVIVPSLTFVATANAAVYVGATVRFADIASLARPLIDVDSVASLITPRTAAICAVHYAGYLADMSGLRALADRHSLALIEDAAHAPGAASPLGQAGALGDVGCFSFFSNKNLVTGEGGMITTDDADVAARLRLLRAHGMTATSWDRERGHATGYDVVETGYNYRPSELEAAIGMVQLEKLPALTARRRHLTSLYRAAISDSGVGEIPFTAEEDGTGSCHILPMVAPDPARRDELRERAAAGGVQTSVHYPPVHSFKVFTSHEPLPVTDAFAAREVTLPLFPDMADSDVSRVVEAICRTNGT